MATKIQHRAICPVCFNEQAVQGAYMVDHGYRCPWHTGGRRGGCAGVDAPHFGTPEGRERARELAHGLRVSGEGQRNRARDILAGKTNVYRLCYGKSTRGEDVLVERDDPAWGYHARVMAREAEYRAEMYEAHAERIQRLVDAWAPAEPRVVEIEKRGPYMHWQRKIDANRMGGRLCQDGPGCAQGRRSPAW